MKNFWLARRKKRELARIAEIVVNVVQQKLWLSGLKGGSFPWQRKKGQPQP
jgi:hypothetical protein